MKQVHFFFSSELGCCCSTLSSSMITNDATELPVAHGGGTQLSLSSNAGTVIVFISAALLFFFLWLYYLCCAEPETAARALRGGARRRVTQRELRRFAVEAPPRPLPPPLPVLPVASCAVAGGMTATDCVICLGEFDDEEEMVKVIPSCRHVFHPQCIDRWLMSQGSCPVCRCTELFASRGDQSVVNSQGTRGSDRHG